jgi:hypothetical protein
MNKYNILTKILIVFCLSFLTQACCVMGTTVTEERIWVASNNPSPKLSSENQLKSCIAEDFKQCSDDYALTCEDVLSGENKAEIINRTTGKPLTELRVKYLKTACVKLKDDPNHINYLCQNREPVDGCMLKNGYLLQKINPVTECKSMQFL